MSWEKGQIDSVVNCLDYFMGARESTVVGRNRVYQSYIIEFDLISAIREIRDFSVSSESFQFLTLVFIGDMTAE